MNFYLNFTFSLFFDFEHCIAHGPRNSFADNVFTIRPFEMVFRDFVESEVVWLFRVLELFKAFFLF